MLSSRTTRSAASAIQRFQQLSIRSMGNAKSFVSFYFRLAVTLGMGHFSFMIYIESVEFLPHKIS